MKKPANEVWLEAIAPLAHPFSNNRRVVRPRGLNTFEHTAPMVLEIDPYYPLVSFAGRKLNYKFAAAEALWIITGRNDLEYLTQYNSNMTKFSDDGITLTGAYGPRINSQLDYVVNALAEDPATRQACLTIWERSPNPSKDIPCTVAMVFQLRDGRLDCHTFMRSSDVFLGLPYDMFSFSMVMRLVLDTYHLRSGTSKMSVLLGTLYLYAASSHLYETDLEKIAFLRSPDARDIHEKKNNMFSSVTSLKVALEKLEAMTEGRE